MSPQASAALGESIRQLMRTSAQPVAVIAAFLPLEKDEHGEPLPGQDRHIHAATLSSFTTVSLAPPLVAFSLRLPSRLVDALRAGAMSSTDTDQGSSPMTTALPQRRPHFLIHLLSSRQQSISDYFARPGAEPFLVPGGTSPTRHLESNASVTENLDGTHPYAVHPTCDSNAVEGMLLFNESMGALACSLVSQIDLMSPDLHGTLFTQASDGDHAAEKGSALFLARIHAVEQDAEAVHRTPLVYFKQKYCTVPKEP